MYHSFTLFLLLGLGLIERCSERRRKSEKLILCMEKGLIYGMLGWWVNDYGHGRMRHHFLDGSLEPESLSPASYIGHLHTPLSVDYASLPNS